MAIKRVQERVNAFERIVAFVLERDGTKIEEQAREIHVRKAPCVKVEVDAGDIVDMTMVDVAVGVLVVTVQ